MMRLLRSLVLGLPLLATAEVIRCATKSPSLKLQKLHETQAKVDSTNRLNGKENTYPKFSVNTFVHVISRGPTESDGNTPQAKVVDQINVLNRNYRGTGFTFLLRNITRIIRKEWVPIFPDSKQELTIKSALRQGNYTDLNIYINEIGGGFGGILGYSSFPDYVTRDIFNLDGVVIDPGTLPNGTIQQYDLGITLVHEIGHWLGLLHTFQEPSGPFITFGTGCTGDGDFIYDTPAEESPAFGCQEGRDTCKDALSLSKQGVDPIHNYMDYSDDFCLDTFSSGQITRVHVLFQQLRVEGNSLG